MLSVVKYAKNRHSEQNATKITIGCNDCESRSLELKENYSFPRYPNFAVPYSDFVSL